MALNWRVIKKDEGKQSEMFKSRSNYEGRDSKFHRENRHARPTSSFAD